MNFIKRQFEKVKNGVRRFWKWLIGVLVVSAATASLGLLPEDAPVAEEPVDERVWYEVPVQWDESMRTVHGALVLVDKATGFIVNDIQSSARAGTLKEQGKKNGLGTDLNLEEVFISEDTLDAIMRSYASSTPESVKSDDARKQEIEDLKMKIEQDGGNKTDINRLEFLLTQ